MWQGDKETINFILPPQESVPKVMLRKRGMENNSVPLKVQPDSPQ